MEGDVMGALFAVKVSRGLVRDCREAEKVGHGEVAFQCGHCAVSC